MKKIIFIILFMYAGISVIAQIPQSINFQGTVYDSNGKVVYNSTKPYIVVTILDNGSPIFKGNTNLKTNQVGAFSFLINQDSLNVTTGNFNTISWNTGFPKVLKVDIAADGVPADIVNYASISLATVPYAFAAKTIQGVDLTANKDGQVLTYDSASGKWFAKSLGGGLIAGNGIDITSNTISIKLIGGAGIKITGGNTISADLKAGTGIIVSGGGDSISTAPMNGDVTGNPTNNMVTKIQGIPVSSNSPTTNQLLQYNGSQWVPVSFKAPIIHVFDSSGTYAAPTNPSPLYVEVIVVGGGGGGGSGFNGIASTFTNGSFTLTANGGQGGGGENAYGGQGGSASLGIITNGFVIAGGQGSGNGTNGGGSGGNTALGGGGGGGYGPVGSYGGLGRANTGGGGGGNGSTNAGYAGGGGGGYLKAIISNPSGSYNVVVGSGGTGSSGANGGTGVVIVEEHFQ